MSTLLVDFGNTRLKWARLGSDGLQEMSSLVHRDLDLPTLLPRYWGALEKASRVLVSCVAAASRREQLTSWIGQHWGCQVEFLSSPAQGSGLVNSYETPERLGSDRWAAMVAARRQAESAFYVVDCGSAVTVDVVDAGGHHLGGLIIPGIRSMLESLGRNTPLALKDIEAVSKIGLGTSTQAAVQSGILGAIACLLNQTVMDPALAPETGLRCFLTGGDAQRIAPLLHTPYEYRAHLVLEGLAIIAREGA